MYAAVRRVGRVYTLVFVIYGYEMHTRDAQHTCTAAAAAATFSHNLICNSLLYSEFAYYVRCWVVAL